MARNLQSQSFTRKKRARFYWTLALVVVIAVSWLRAAMSLTGLEAFAIDQVKVSGGDAAISVPAQLAAERAMQGYYIGLFPRDSALIYPKGAIIDAVEAISPRIESVSVGRDGFHTLIVSIAEKSPSAIVCASLPDFNGNRFVFDDHSDCYLADSSGLLFASAASSTLSGDYDVYFAPDLSAGGSVSVISSFATSTAEFVALQSFYDGARTAGMSPDAILIKQDGEYELYASTTVIYFNDMRPLSDELANLSVFLSHMKGASFDYIDLRYGSNVFYKQL